METIGSRIAHIRKNEKLNQTEFAKIIGISQGNLSDMEKNKFKPSAETLLSINRYFGVSIDWLLIGEMQNQSEDLINKYPETLPNIKNLTPGERLKILRIKSGLTAEQLADKLNIPLDMIIHWEDVGPVNWEVIDVFAKYYNVPDVWIKYGEDSPYDAEYKVVDESDDIETVVLRDQKENNLVYQEVNEEENALLDMYRDLPRNDKDDINAMISFKHSRLKGVKKKAGSSTFGRDELAASDYKIG